MFPLLIGVLVAAVGLSLQLSAKRRFRFLRLQGIDVRRIGESDPAISLFSSTGFILMIAGATTALFQAASILQDHRAGFIALAAVVAVLALGLSSTAIRRSI